MGRRTKGGMRKIPYGGSIPHAKGFDATPFRGGDLRFFAREWKNVDKTFEQMLANHRQHDANTLAKHR